MILSHALAANRHPIRDPGFEDIDLFAAKAADDLNHAAPG